MISRTLLNSRASASASAKLLHRGLSSTAADPPKFDAEMVAIYSRLAEQHRHPKGPWPLMTDKVAEIAGGEDASVKILDLATGPGEPAKTIAKWMPNSTVIASDVAEDMIAKHETYLGGVPNVTSLLASAEDLSAVPSNSQDFVTCCYGYMFPSDKDKAVEETYRVLKPGGYLVATTWNVLPMVNIAGDIMEAVLGERPEAPALNPMALSEPGLFEGMVTKAGFKDIDISTSTYPFNFSNDKEFQVKIGTILVKDKIEELGKQDVAKEAFFANVGKYSTISDDGSLMVEENTFQMLVAKK